MKLFDLLSVSRASHGPEYPAVTIPSCIRFTHSTADHRDRIQRPRPMTVHFELAILCPRYPWNTVEDIVPVSSVSTEADRVSFDLRATKTGGITSAGRICIGEGKNTYLSTRCEDDTAGGHRRRTLLLCCSYILGAPRTDTDLGISIWTIGRAASSTA